MSETSSRSPSAEEPTPDSSAPELEHAVVENDADATECTVYPRNCADADLVTRWLTAKEGSYVSLAEMR